MVTSNLLLLIWGFIVSLAATLHVVFYPRELVKVLLFKNQQYIITSCILWVYYGVGVICLVLGGFGYYGY